LGLFLLQSAEIRETAFNRRNLILRRQSVNEQLKVDAAHVVVAMVVDVARRSLAPHVDDHFFFKHSFSKSFK